MPELQSHNGYYLWHYVPNLVAAIIFEVLFVLVTLYHGWMIAKTKTWFCIVFAIGGLRKSSKRSALPSPRVPVC